MPARHACGPLATSIAGSPASMTSRRSDSWVESFSRLPMATESVPADKTAAVEDELRTLRARIAELEARPVATRDVAVIPPQVTETLAEIAARAEAMAARVEEQLKA